MRKILAGLSLVLAALVGAPNVASGRSVKQSLHPTVVDANAQGVAMASIHAKQSQGKFRIIGRHLKPGTTFGISVAGVRIGSFTTSSAGSGSARFSNPQHGSDQFLGVDPAGHLVEVSDDQGEDVMEGDMPDDSQGQGDIQCCVPDDDGTECEETSPADCTAANGTPMSAGSCFPNPCPTTPPSGDIVCCVPNAGQGDCNEESAADCADEGGVNVGAVSCVPDPCAPTMPGVIRCCVPENDDTQGDQNQQGNAGECEQLTATDCTNEGGTSMGPGSCEPNPCPVSSATGAFLN